MSKEGVQEQALRRVGELVRGKWQIDRLLDIGGMASVFAATHRNGKKVAIKVLHAAYAENEDVRQRFLREGYVANAVDHPGAVAVLDDDTLDDGSPFLVMELLEGVSLETRLQQQSILTPAEVMHVAERVLDVLAAAHDKGIVHRDIKPGNLFLGSDGEVKVLDFGLARVRERSMKGSLTRTGIVLGTASYMPPEQARGKRDLIDARTDIWAVGATMFKALTSRYVHEGATVNERLIAAMSQRARSVGKVAPQLPAPLVALVDRALEFQKTDRWPDARSMRDGLRHVYQVVEKQPIPSQRRAHAAWVATERNPPTFEPDSDVHVSIVFEPSRAGDSVIVEVEEEGGKPERYEMRRKAAAPDPTEDELSEVSVVEMPPTRTTR
jgi:eukaryotic-like serine/threonine-protein kinase